MLGYDQSKKSHFEGTKSERNMGETLQHTSVHELCCRYILACIGACLQCLQVLPELSYYLYVQQFEGVINPSNIFFYDSDPTLPSVRLDLDHDGRDRLWAKTKQAFQYAYKHYR